MGFGTLAVGAAVAPTVIETSLFHYLNRKPLRHKPTAHVSYDVGLNLIRQFLVFASHHTVDEIQAFTQQYVPNPPYVRLEDITITESCLIRATDHIRTQLGPEGLEAVGGPTWWQWRREGEPLKAQWVEMRKDYHQRQIRKEKCTRTMLYIHGGAYYFGSVDEHRYQITRHARKLQARVLAPRYRLAPQFPFPCGLLDCLATYLQMLETQSPKTIVFAGDSAGGGMVVSLLVILRDEGIPMPAGAILLSPWVDLTHSFPSVAGNNELDYIPAHGFHHRPSTSWPPPNSDDLKLLEAARKKDPPFNDLISSTRPSTSSHSAKEAAPGFEVTNANGNNSAKSRPEHIQSGGNLSINIDGKLIELKDQIQMYAHNALLSHPLVSPALTPSLGGLPPLCVLVGGGEMLRDEQIYLAHKAAAPSDYPPTESALAAQSHGAAEAVHKWPPTDVQLQVWDDMCHVAPTLSFTRPAKYMYRSVAQFGAWALARAQKRPIRILDDDEISIISDASSDEGSSNDASSKRFTSSAGLKRRGTFGTQIGKAGDPLPKFVSHMIRQRVTRHGEIYHLASASKLPACTMRPSDVGAIKPGPVRKWMTAQEEWNGRYSKEKRNVQKRRLEEMSVGYMTFEGETPPPTALAGRRQAGYKAKPQKQKRSRGLAMWSGWGGKHDEVTVRNEEAKEKAGKRPVVPDEPSNINHTNGAAATTQTSLAPPVRPTAERSASRSRIVSDEGQTNSDPTESIPLVAEQSPTRPAIDGQAFPFKLAAPITGEHNASTMTLADEPGIIRPSSKDTDIRPLSVRSKSSGFGIFDDREEVPYVPDMTSSKVSGGLFAGSGHTWGAESIGAGTSEQERERPGFDRFVTAFEMPKA